MSTYIQAGVSRRDGVLKVRFSSDTDYATKLTKQGDSDIDLITFLTPLTKIEALAKLVDIDFAAGNQEIADCIARNQAKRMPRVPRAARQPRVNELVQRLFERIDSLEERIAILEHPEGVEQYDQDYDDIPY